MDTHGDTEAGGSDDDDRGIGERLHDETGATGDESGRTLRSLQPFKTTAGGVRVETWIAKVDLAVEGARISGRGDWNDEDLYYVVGNKL
ncbi:hypothetical protein PF004_g26786 [Phytophthora fragariae]|uniref:Uncharacterized protein n=1 Tax=Phytophthora fragariae TaxID=53985 RepID=A0A6G0MNE2_9STRA|nr:hypothetical protein PF004_g26786 [Phytophthora fragariae]